MARIGKVNSRWAEIWSCFCFKKLEIQGGPNILVFAWGFRLVKSAEAAGEFGRSAGRCKQVNIVPSLVHNLTMEKLLMNALVLH